MPVSAHISNTKPDFDKGLFWDWRYPEINWHLAYRSVIERVLERGTTAERAELIRFYGQAKILRALREEIKFLPEHTIEEVSKYFDLRKEDMACVRRKQFKSGQWI